MSDPSQSPIVQPEQVPTPPPLPGTRIDPLAAAQAAPTPPPLPAAPAAEEDTMRAALDAAGFGSQSGVKHRKFTSRKVADEVTLEVDGARYRCASTAPSGPLLRAVKAQQNRLETELIEALSDLITAVMFPADRARYEARLNGAVTEDIDGVPTDLSPIDPIDLISHGMWLVEVYFARPTVQSGPSGSGR